MKKRGFTLVEIMIVVAIIGLLAAIAIPSFTKIRSESRKSACMNGQRMVRDAVDQWAMANNKKETDEPESDAILEYIKGGVMPVCPEGGTPIALPATVATDVACPNGLATHTIIPVAAAPAAE